ncbi:MAG: recombination mediator RecR [Verrucomicrobiota bacterium]
MPLPEPITALAAALGRLPGIGPRTAERLALHLAQADSQAVRQLADALLRARAETRACSLCGALTERDPCAICSDPRREDSSICVVERPVDIFTLEKAAVFHGKYHVLGGKISPLNGVEPEDLRIAALESRMGPGVREIILALSTDVEGDATTFYLGKRLAGKGAKISRLAYGLPAGSGLEFADEITLTRALEGRRDLA